jgi:hypothetical protein
MTELFEIILKYIGFDVFMAVKIYTTIFWVLKLSSISVDWLEPGIHLTEYTKYEY